MADGIDANSLTRLILKNPSVDPLGPPPRLEKILNNEKSEHSRSNILPNPMMGTGLLDQRLMENKSFQAHVQHEAEINNRKPSGFSRKYELIRRA